MSALAAFSETPCPICGSASVAGFCRRCAFSHALAGLSGGESIPPTAKNPPIGAPEGFELIHEIGRGATAVVWLARERKLDRFVALKLISLHSDSRLAQRLVREGQAVARLNHPHIVAVYELGSTEQSAFLAMEFLEGGDLRQKLKEGVLLPNVAAQLVATLAEALEHSHLQKILHRDIKPSNVLLDATGEPKLADFGLAAPLEGAGDLTLPGQIAGTAAYLAPELLAGAEHASERSDLYSLGAVLYECLVGRAPFIGDSSATIFAQIANAEPSAPRLLQPGIPRDLETICLKCLQKYPHLRYTNARELHADLNRFLRGEPIAARPISAVGRGTRWARRNPTLAGLSAALVLATVLGVAGIFSQWRRAEAAATRTAQNLYSADLKVASDALLAGNLGLAQRTLGSCPTSDRDVAWELLWPFTYGDVEKVLGQTGGTITHLALSPDGGLAVNTAQADNIHLWDLTNNRTFKLPETTYSWWAEFSRDGRQLFTADQKVKQWDLAKRAVLREFPGRSGAISADGETLYTCEGQRFLFEGHPGSVHAWKIRDGSAVFNIPLQARLLAVSPDGKLLAVSDAEKFIQIFDAQDGHAMGEPWSSHGGIWSLTFSPDSASIVASGWSTEVRVWKVGNLANSAEPKTLHHPSGTWAAAFSKDGSTLAIACSDSRIHLWDTTTWQETRFLSGHTNEVWSVVWQQNGRVLSGGRDLRLLDLRNGSEPQGNGLRHDQRPYNIVWLNRGSLATVRSIDAAEVMEIASVEPGRPTLRFPGEAPVAFDAQKKEFWSWAEGRELRVRSEGSLAQFKAIPFPLSANEVLAAKPSINPGVGLAWAALKDGALVVHRLSDGGRTARYDHVFSEHSGIVALSPDGSRIVWGGVSTELYMLDLKTGQRFSLKGHRYEISAIAFAPDGKTFFTGGADGLIIEWNTQSAQRRRDLGQHPTSVGALALSPDGAVLFSQEPGVGLHLWHPRTGREIGFLAVGGSYEAEWIGLSPDARWLGARRSDGSISVFPLAQSSAELTPKK